MEAFYLLQCITTELQSNQINMYDNSLFSSMLQESIL